MASYGRGSFDGFDSYQGSSNTRGELFHFQITTATCRQYNVDNRNNCIGNALNPLSLKSDYSLRYMCEAQSTITNNYLCVCVCEQEL